MRDPTCGEQIAEGKASIGRAVIAHKALDLDAVSREPGEGAAGEGDRTLLAFIAKHFGVREAAGIVDRHMQEFPAGAALIALSGAVTADAMADAIDAAELLNIDVDQLTRTLTLIPDDRRARIEGAQPAEPMTAQHHPDGGERPPEATRHGRGGATLMAQRNDLGFGRLAELTRAAPGPRGPIQQARFT